MYRQSSPSIITYHSNIHVILYEAGLSFYTILLFVGLCVSHELLSTFKNVFKWLGVLLLVSSLCIFTVGCTTMRIFYDHICLKQGNIFTTCIIQYISMQSIIYMLILIFYSIFASNYVDILFPANDCLILSHKCLILYIDLC